MHTGEIQTGSVCYAGRYMMTEEVKVMLGWWYC